MPIIVVHSLAISIHAPHEGVRLDFSNFPIRIFISIHAPHEGVRRFRCDRASIHYRFQSTHPTRGCDYHNLKAYYGTSISIHAPHEGVRPLPPLGHRYSHNISIHAPHEGVRRLTERQHKSYNYFNPRTPRGGATAICCSLISRVTTCCRPNITPLLDVVRFLNYCTNLLLFLGEPPRLFRTASGSPMSLHY